MDDVAVASGSARAGAAPERQHILAFMGVIHRIEAANQDRATSRLDLRARIVIQYLGLSGHSSILAIRQRLNVTPSTMTSISDRLEKGGYVRRRPHPTDRRTTMLELTAKGRRAFEGEIDFYERLIDQGLAPFDAGTRQKMLRTLEELPEPRQEG